MGQAPNRPPRHLAPIPRLLWWVWRAAQVVGHAGLAFVRTSVAPVAQRAGSRSLRWLGTAALTACRGAWRNRGVAVGLAARVAWWAALWFAVRGTLVLLGVSPLGDDDAILRPFIAGLALSAVVVCVSAERHLRRGGILLGALHAALLTLSWTAVSFAAAA
ncbi:MAG: hypothetical protein AAF721_36790 [Myxococcota bacterium]